MTHDKYDLLRTELENVLKRFQIADSIAKRFIAQSVKQLRLAVRAQKQNIHVPDKPPARWPHDRAPGENPDAYVKRIYGDLIKHNGMTQADLAEVDKKALNALRNYCAKRNARPKRPRASDVIPPSKRNPDEAVAKYGKLTWANSVGAYNKNPTPENLERKRAFNALDTRKSRARHRDPT